MRPAVVSGMSTGTRQSAVACWPTFSPAPVTAPVVFAKVSSAQFTSRFKSGKLEKVFAMCFKLIVLLAAPKENYSPKESYHNGCVYDATSMKVKENRTP